MAKLMTKRQFEALRHADKLSENVVKVKMPQLHVSDVEVENLVAFFKWVCEIKIILVIPQKYDIYHGKRSACRYIF
jgi:hypothetical protein